MFSQSFVAIVTLISLATAAPLSRRALDLGSCSDPTIKFAEGLDGRNEAAFAPNNANNFNHGSALNIGVIASFICGQLQSACKAGQDAIDACAAGQSAATGLTGQAAADAFNAALTGGASSDGAASNDADNASSGDAAAADCPAAVTVTVTASSAAATAAPADANESNASSDSAAASGGNLQTFTGDLGGLPPPVTVGGRGFVVNGSDFLNIGAALQRSCDVQHNACSNQANAGADFPQSDCETQNADCRSAIST